MGDKIYKTASDEFEDAVRKFGVDNALEYFNTPEEKHADFDFLKKPAMKEKILNASNIQKIQWDDSNLIIYFHNGGVYQYFDIPEELSVWLGDSESPGAYLHHEIKGKYRYARID